MKNKKNLFAILAIALIFALAACSNGSTGGKTPPPGEAQVQTFVGEANGEFYILKITENTGAALNMARYAAKKGDTYELTVGSPVSGSKTSKGKVDKVENNKYTLIPDNSTTSFTATVDTAQSGITQMTGTITMSDDNKTTKSAPGDTKPGGLDGDLHYCEYEYENNIVIVILRYSGNGGNVTIPSQINGKPVAAIAWEAFAKTEITGVTIPNSVIFIFDHAFADCISLTTLNVSAGDIGSNAFEGCTSLTSATIGNGVTNIAWEAFLDCTSLASVNIPSSVTELGGRAFQGCTSLTSVTIPSSVKALGWGAFIGCTSLTGVTLPNNADIIAYGGAFWGCSSLKTITIPSGVTKIGGNTFQECFNLTSVTIPSSVTEIDGWAFADCHKLIGVTIPSGITKINDGVFNECASLTSITIPSGVTNIGFWAFEGCTSLTSVTFQGIISDDKFGGLFTNDDDTWFVNGFDGDLRDKYLAGGIGTYTRDSDGWEWTKK
jgi:hypothetical protein